MIDENKEQADEGDDAYGDEYERIEVRESLRCAAFVDEDLCELDEREEQGPDRECCVVPSGHIVVSSVVRRMGQQAVLGDGSRR